MSGQELALYSGKVRLCECGLETGAIDMEGKQLFSGDIVAIYIKGSDGQPGYRPTLTAVVVENDEAFIMGIRSVPMDDPCEWRVWRIKSHEDAVAGEHWREWGFHFEQATQSKDTPQ